MNMEKAVELCYNRDRSKRGCIVNLVFAVFLSFSKERKDKMGQKDLSEKILEDYDDVFADIMNGLLFDGEERIKPSSLKNTSVHSQYKADDKKLHEQERDIAKYWTDYNVELAICGIENQTKVEKRMPFRIIEYDGAAYRSQLQAKRKEMVPVVTIVLYFGTQYRWRAAKNIKALMDIPKELDPYVNDYHIHVFEIAWLSDEQVSKFKSDFRIVANFFVNKRKNKDYIPDDPSTIKHVDEVLKLLAVMTGDNRYREIYLDKKGVRNMCDVADRLEKIGFEKGEAKGEAEGKAKGEAKLGKLIVLLTEKGLEADILKAASDEKARQEMYKKYGIDD